MSKPRCQSVDIDIEPDCCAVRCDAQQLQEVLAELLANAATASKGQATVRMQAGNADNVVRLRVIDNGPGMNAATLAMAFVPFFSSRPAGRGRGLGLPQALRKIQANGGRMGIESQSGAGTTVTIELPRAEPA
jgi:signal transduction histidine kinase